MARKRAVKQQAVGFRSLTLLPSYFLSKVLPFHPPTRRRGGSRRRESCTPTRAGGRDAHERRGKRAEGVGGVGESTPIAREGSEAWRLLRGMHTPSNPHVMPGKVAV